MNKKINELAKQAGLIASVYDDLDFKTSLTPAEQKFADLIIRECASIYEAIDNGNKVEGTDNYIKALRVRFEV